MDYLYYYYCDFFFSVVCLFLLHLFVLVVSLTSSAQYFSVFAFCLSVFEVSSLQVAGSELLLRCLSLVSEFGPLACLGFVVVVPQFWWLACESLPQDGACEVVGFRVSVGLGRL